MADKVIPGKTVLSFSGSFWQLSPCALRAIGVLSL